MKIRTGFVSNSSSSSFLIYGVNMDFEALKKFLKIRTKKTEHGDEDYSLFDDKLKEKKISYEIDYDNREAFIGRRPWYDQGDDETKKQFMERTTQELRAIGITEEPSIYEGEIYS